MINCNEDERDNVKDINRCRRHIYTNHSVSRWVGLCVYEVYVIRSEVNSLKD